MRGKLYVLSVYDEETNDMKPGPAAPIENVTLVTAHRDFYGYVVQCNGLTMLSPVFQIGQDDILMSGPVLTGPNYSLPQEWRFVPDGVVG